MNRYKSTHTPYLLLSAHRPPSPSPPPTPPPADSPASTPKNPLKRKDNPAEDRTRTDRAPEDELPAGAALEDGGEGEYEQGRVLCQSCGSSISFRDDDTKEFTLKHWNAHRQVCPSAPSGSSEPVLFTPDSAAQALTHPPAKRRRAKRTEEERIEYLRADPYVAKFEAYRVLCASCDKWIRLRPNSTYCSIPWDAHRKSCLAKKINNKNVYALEERNSLFSKDPDVRKFDPERVLCNICDKWIPLPPDDHLQAVHKWLQHRASCQKAHAPSSSATHTRGESTSLPVAAGTASTPGPSHTSGQPVPSSSAPRQPTTSAPPPTSPTSPSASAHLSAPPRFHATSPPAFLDLNPANYAPAHESRRRNAEQRAATLRADRLIGEVEPNRVFCSLCQKWVQLRQDSSYCAYPWIQHRGKCLARHQRRAAKLAEIEQGKASGSRGGPTSHDEDQLMSEDDGAGDPTPSDDFESEDGADSTAEQQQQHQQHHRSRGKVPTRRPEPRRIEERYYAPSAPSKHLSHHHKSRSMPHYSSASVAGPSSSSSRPPHQPPPSGPAHPSSSSSSSYRHIYRPSHGSRGSRLWDDNADADGDDDAEGDEMDEDNHPPPRYVTKGPFKRSLPASLADLDSESGRRQFVFASVEYLFATTYEPTDEMSISALLLYLNAAMPPDKHEDFDIGEVARAVGAMKEKGRIIFEGDTLRLID